MMLLCKGCLKVSTLYFFKKLTTMYKYKYKVIVYFFEGNFIDTGTITTTDYASFIVQLNRMYGEGGYNIQTVEIIEVLK